MLHHNKRSIKRRHLIYYLRVFNQNTQQLIGHLVDITPEGIMVMSETPLEVNVTYTLRMDLPADTFGKEHLELEAHALWNKPDINPTFTDTGFQLVSLSEADERILRRLIDEYGFRD